MTQPKRRLKVDLIELESALDSRDPSMDYAYYLDLETGAVVLVTGEERDAAEEVRQNYSDPQTGAVDWETVLPLLDVPDWQKDGIPLAYETQTGYKTRFMLIPPREPYDGYNEMVDFIETVTNPRLQGRLEQAIRGKGAFRRFRAMLLDFPKERERWFDFINARSRERTLEWLEDAGIELIEE